MTLKEPVRPDQYSFLVDGVSLSLISASAPGAELLATRIRNDRLWPSGTKNPNGTLINWYTDSGSTIAFDAHTLEIHPKSDEKRFSVVAITAPPMNELTEEQSAKLVEAVTKLRKKKSVLYLLEPIGSNTDVAWRIDALEDVGLVERSVDRIPGNYLLWRGRLRKEHPHNAVDLIESWKNSDTQWKHTKLHDQAVRVAERFGALNYKVVSWKEIEERLHASKNVKADFEALEAGRGVVIEATCGCQWRIDLHGGQTRTLRCGTQNCDGLSAPPDVSSSDKVQKKEHRYGHEVILDTVCGLCKTPTSLIEDSRIVKELPNGRLRIFVETRCPHHGLINGWAKNITIKADQFIR